MPEPIAAPMGGTPEPIVAPVGGTPKPQPVGGNPPAEPPKETFDQWLAKRTDTERALLDEHTAGLRSALQKERDANKKRDDEAKAAEEKRKLAEMSEIDRAKAQSAKDAEKMDEMTSTLQMERARLAFWREASKQKVEFANEKAEDDALNAALALIEFDDTGQPKNTSDALKAVLKERPYLVKAASVATGTPRQGGRPQRQPETKPEPNKPALRL